MQSLLFLPGTNQRRVLSILPHEGYVIALFDNLAFFQHKNTITGLNG